MRIGQAPDLEMIRSLLTYDRETGVFVWNRRNVIGSWNQKFAGKVAGTVCDRGYIYICINKRKFSAHRLAWLYVTGEWPELEIDHKNTIKGDNWFDNLRLATFFQNQQNKGLVPYNSSGLKGVSWRSDRDCWRAVINANGRFIHLGHFSEKKDARIAYTKAATELHGEFANL